MFKKEKEESAFYLEPIFSSFLVKKKLDLDTKEIKTWVEREFKRDLHEDYKIELQFNEKVLKDFYFKINQILDKLHVAIGFSKNTKQQIQSAWVNVNSNERTSIPHCHSYSDFICVYYPYVEHGSGNLELMNPNASIEYAFPQGRNNTIIESHNIFNSRLWEIVPENDLLVIFPSWLIHYVKQGIPNTTRMSIALNSKIVPN